MAFFKQEAVTINFSFKDFFSVWDSIEGGKIVTWKIFLETYCVKGILYSVTRFSDYSAQYGFQDNMAYTNCVGLIEKGSSFF